MQDEEQLGVVEIPVNPRNPEMYDEEPVMLQTSTLFQPMEGHSIKNYSLVFRVYEASDDDTESSSESSGSSSDSDSVGSGYEFTNIAAGKQQLDHGKRPCKYS